MTPNDSRNFRLNVLDGVFFSTGVAFFSHAGIVPLYVATLTDARWPVGLVTPVMMLGIALPQIFGAAFLARRSDFWPAINWACLHPRLWVLALAGVPFLPAPYTLLGFFVVWAAYALALGFCIPMWTTFVAQVIPAGVRGGFFGIRTTLGGLMALIGTGAVSGLLTVYPGRTGFALCFFIAAVLLFASLAAFACTRYDWTTYVPLHTADGFWTDVRETLRTNRGFRRYLYARIATTVTVAATGYYAVYGVETFGLTTAQGSLLALVIVIVPNLTAAFWGTLADRLGNRRVQVPLLAVASLANGVLAVTHSLAIYAVCLAAAGLVNVVVVVFDNKVMMEMDQARCGTLVGVLNLSLAPALLLVPLGAAVLAEGVGMTAVFWLTAGAVAIAALLLAVPVRSVLPRDSWP